MNRPIFRVLVIVLLGWPLVFGCGTTKWSDTKRTATEQLLISDAMDRAVAKMDFRAVAGKKVYLDSDPLRSVTDASYLVSLLRQHMLASGCRLMEKRDDADYVIEVRAGAVGTDRREVTFGVPATKALNALPVAASAPVIPEMPLANKTEQRAVVKLALFAYNRNTGRPVWQSGTVPIESTAKNLWVLGAGPFERGTIYEGTGFAGKTLEIPLIDIEAAEEGQDKLAVTGEAYFAEPKETPALQQMTAAQLAKLGANPAAKEDAEEAVSEKDKRDKAKPAQVAKKDASEKKSAAKKSEVVPATHNADIPAEPDDETAPD